jgi:hypothetical protein
VTYLTFTIQLSSKISSIKMASVLITCIKEEQCAVMQFLWAEMYEVQKIAQDYRQNSVLLQQSIHE